MSLFYIRRTILGMYYSAKEIVDDYDFLIDDFLYHFIIFFVLEIYILQFRWKTILFPLSPLILEIPLVMM